jgi:FkbM family methyltransferase
MSTAANSWSHHPTLRRLVLPLLKRFNPGNIRIRHHYTRDPLLLHSFKHKGYWFYGRAREQQTMRFFESVLGSNDTVVEVGGHIGYITLLFAKLVGEGGRVIVFEPGSNNLPYIRANVAPRAQIELVEMAISHCNGVATFFEEGLTGQNNSLCADYGVFRENQARAFDDSSYQAREVETITLDAFVEQRNIVPQLIKIDIEGAELQALQGAEQTLRTIRPLVMVEVTQHKSEVFDLLRTTGYELRDESGAVLQHGSQMNFNVFAIDPERHADALHRLGWQQAAAA